MAQHGFLPLPWSEIESWSRLHRIPLKAWELQIIAAIDDIWLDVMGRKTVTMDDLVGHADD